MKCGICGRSPVEGITVYRVNEKGVDGIWRCKAHLTFNQEASIDPEVKMICDIIEGHNRDIDSSVLGSKGDE